MTFAKKMSLMLSLTAAMTLSAHAQDAQAKFKLPHDARLGEATLPAGEYTVTLSLEGNTKAYIVPAGKGAAMIVLPVSTDEYASCTASSVSMHRSGTAWSVSSICFAEPQIALHFATPGAKEALASAAPAPVAVAEGR
jgi:hypothetical protein